MTDYPLGFIPQLTLTAQDGILIGVPVDRLRALVRILFPDEMTSTAKRMIESVCDEYDQPEKS